MKSKTKIRPHRDRLVVKPLDPPKYSPGGIALPDTCRTEKLQRAEIHFVGPGDYQEDGTRRMMDFRPGQTVLLREFGGVELELDGEKFLIISDADVLAVVE